MTKQSEALRLADLADNAPHELRRLREVNAELLRALQWIAGHDFSAANESEIAMMAWAMKSMAQVVSNKATGETE
jgi:hypothetical protein